MRSSEHHADAGVDHVLSRRHGISFEYLAFATAEFGETKVEHFHDAVVTQHDVVGLDIAMNDADGVSRGKGAGDLDADVEGVAGGESGSSDATAECVAVDELGGDELF